MGENLVKRLIVEFIGPFALCFMGIGAIVLTGTGPDYSSRLPLPTVWQSVSASWRLGTFPADISIRPLPPR